MPRYLALFALMFAVAGSACTSSPAAETATPARDGATPAAAPAAPLRDGRAIEITATDTMKFSVAEITAKRGEVLSVTLVNLGTTPKFSMGHNWVLLTPDADVQQFLLAAADAAPTEYVPASQKPRIIAATKLLGPNERHTVTFAAPDKPGRYDFLCSFPGHYQVGMRGVLIVQ
jgi:azurin